jgi:hypothetical protein
VDANAQLDDRVARVQDPLRRPTTGVTRLHRKSDALDLTLDDGGRSSLWWATKNEWLGLIDVAGLELEALYGGFAREAFTDDSREYVFIARR